MKIIINWIFIFGCVLVVEGYELEKCYCWGAMDSTLKEKLTDIAPPSEVPPYHYIGIKPQPGDSFKYCFCNDVVRFVTSLNIEIQNSSNFQLSSILRTFVNEKLVELLESDKTDNDVSDVRATQNGTNISGSTAWEVEIEVKGHATKRPSQVKALLTSVLNNGDGGKTFPSVGVVTGDINFSELTCAGTPLGAPQNGKRTWAPSKKYPGQRALYSCDPGYYIEEDKLAYSECLHGNLTWAKPAANLTCKIGCQSQPPKGPFFSFANWKPTMREEDIVVTYSCIKGYHAVDNVTGTSTCKKSKWTELNQDFRCEQTLCPDTIPQVPAHGRSDWDGSSRYVDTYIHYTCMDGYSPTVMGTVKVFCSVYGKWNPLPQGFKCINNDLAVRLGIFDDQHIRSYDYYEDGYVNDPRVADKNWFWVVTVPSILGLVLATFCCMVCTRPDSPLFYLCTGNSRKAEYLSY